MIFTNMFVLLTMTLVSGETLKLKFSEKGNEYTETISINVQKNIVEYDVPAHPGVDQAKYLTDYNQKLTVMKLESMKKCYAMDISPDEANITNVDIGFKQMHGKFPENKYWVEHIDIMPIDELDSTMISQEIKDFCSSYPVIKVIKSTAEKMQEIALKSAKALTTRQSKRQTNTVNAFFVCSKDLDGTIWLCKEKNLQVMCRFVVSKTSVYQVTCSNNGYGGFVCNVPTHIFTRLHCCDYTCSKLI